MSGPRSQRTRIRSLEIIQNTAPSSPSTAMGFIKDGLGEFRINLSTIRQRFLEAFRLRSEHAASLDDSMRDDIARRLIAEYGGPKAAADALWALARENEWYREGEQAERYLFKQLAGAAPIRNEAAINFTIAWHGQQIGVLRHDGFEWRWQPENGFKLPLVRQTDTHLMALEDMCSILDLPPESKYDGTIERIMRAVRPLSTAPAEKIFD